MTADELRAAQAPFKERYRGDPASAVLTMRAGADLAGPGVGCTVPTFGGTIIAGLHPAAGGDGSQACAGDMLLEALAACTGVTLRAVATALGLPLQGGRIRIEGDLDFRGTLGVDREAPVGFREIRLDAELEGDLSPEQVETLLKLTKRYCVVFRTLETPPTMTARFRAQNGAAAGESPRTA